MRAIRIHQTGGPEKMLLEDIGVPVPREGQVRLRVDAAGLNFIDIYLRKGIYPLNLPATLGSEAAGVITAVGPDVTDFKVGDRVATIQAAGAYAEEAIAPAEKLVRIPEGVEASQAAALLAQGLTADFLTSATFPVQPGSSVLIHAAAGGVGMLLVQLAKRRGARVLATAGGDDKARYALKIGADEAVVYTREDFVAAARRFTNGHGVDVVFDGVGRDTFVSSLNALRPRGTMVTFGNASGVVEPFSPMLLAEKGSLFLTRPTGRDYFASPGELRTHARTLFDLVLKGELTVRIGSIFSLKDAAAAHLALEGRKTIGKVLILPQKY